MAYGIKLVNDQGSLSISETYKNPPLSASGSVTTTSLSYFNFTSAAAISYTRNSVTDMPLLAIRPTGPTSILYVQNTETLTWTWQFYSEQAPGTSIPYWLFSTEKAIPVATGYGMQIYNAGGAVVFNTDMKPLRLVDIATKTLADTSLGGGSTDFTYLTGRTYATVLTRWSESNFYFAMANQTTRFWGATQGITNGIRLLASQQETITGQNVTPAGWNVMRTLVVDVTDY